MPKLKNIYNDTIDVRKMNRTWNLMKAFVNQLFCDISATLLQQMALNDDLNIIPLQSGVEKY